MQDALSLGLAKGLGLDKAVKVRNIDRSSYPIREFPEFRGPNIEPQMTGILL